MNKNILKFCLEKGLLLDTETHNFLSDFDEDTAKGIIRKIASLNEKVITKSVISKNAGKIQHLIEDDKLLEKLKIKFNLSLEISKEVEKISSKEDKKENLLGNIKVLETTPNISKKLEVRDFVTYFRKRYNDVKKIIQGRNIDNLTSIGKLGNKREGVGVIGMVYSKRMSRNGNILFEVEDLTGRIRVLINKNKEEIFKIGRDILIDDIIGIRGYGDDEIIFANDIIYPDSAVHEKTRLSKDENAVFIADLHIGSSNFLKEKFEKFLKWLNLEIGGEKQKEMARKVKYLFIVGDNVDGVGVFPGQDDFLEIKDIREQYKELVRYLKEVRKDIKIIICPGNHDAVWLGQPQPPINKEYVEELYEMDNVILVSNPALVEISEGGKGIKVLMYHGAGLNAYINRMDSLRGVGYDKPSMAVKELLKRRHLSSIHSDVDYIPWERKDPLVIKRVPDVITTADLHKQDLDNYNNISIICNSCWQSQTPFEEKIGHHPDPCKINLMNLKSREIKIIDFSDGDFE
jgi:DNA polymerase II small subunit